MRPRSTLTLTALALAASCMALTLGPSTADAQRVPSGDRIVTGHRAQSGTDTEWGWARGVVAHPIDRVMEVVQDYASYNQYMPHFRTSRVLSQRGTQAMVYFEVSVLRDTTTLWAQMRIRERPNRGDTRIIDASMIQGNVDAFRAHWEITPIDATHTLVEFRILVDPDMPLPSSLFTDQNVKAARNTIRSIRRRMAR